MKKLIYFFVLCFSASFFNLGKASSLTEVLIESDDYAKVFNVEKRFNGTVLVFDLDDTLFTPSEGNILGSSCWFYDIVKSVIYKDKVSIKDAGDRVYPLATLVLSHTEIQPTQPNLASIIKKVQQQGGECIGLTARRPTLNSSTLKKLASLDINLKLNTVEERWEYEEAAYIGGVIFACEYHDKGLILKNFLSFLSQKYNKNYKSIVFIDDMLKNLTNVYEKFKEDNYQLTLIKYTRYHHLQQSYCPLTAATKLKKFIDKLILIEDREIQLLLASDTYTQEQHEIAWNHQDKS